MIKITAEITPHYEAVYSSGQTFYQIRVKIVKDDDTYSAIQKVIRPEELYTSSIFNRIFDSMKDQLMREFEKQQRIRDAQ